MSKIDPKSEAAFWKRIKDDVELGLLGGKWERVECKLPSGFADTVVHCGKGVTLFVELKHVDKVADLSRELRAEQAVWLNRVQKAGGYAFVYAWVVELGNALWFDTPLALRNGVFVPCSMPRELVP